MSDRPADLDEMNERDFEELISAMRTDDPLTQAIKGCMYVEQQLVQFVEENLPAPGALKAINPSYETWVALALALGLPSQYGRPLRALSSIRNKFAHSTKALLGDNEVDNFYNTFEGADKQRIQGIFADSKTSRAGNDLRSLAPSERFALLIVVLRGIVIVARHRSKQYRVLSTLVVD